MKEAIEDIPAVMTAKELASFLKMSPRWGYQTVQRMAREGKIKGLQVGDLWRFTRAQVQAYLAGK
jgi:excisionase family DNA binding protein